MQQLFFFVIGIARVTILELSRDKFDVNKLILEKNFVYKLPAALSLLLMP